MPTNGFDSKQLQGYLSEIDGADDEIERLKEEYKDECRPYKERIKDVLGAAKDAGINMAAFRAVLAEHRADRRLAKRVALLDMADRADYEAMNDALGDFVETPLGQSAIEKFARTLKEAGGSVEVRVTDRA